ncbi:MAG: PEGA domain-containing protein [Myxococcota bacterium]
MTSWLLPLLLHAGAPAVTVVLEGPAASDAKGVVSSLQLPVELRLADSPMVSPAAPSSTAWNSKLASARRHYVGARFVECLAELEGDAAVTELLSRGERTLAARLLTWRAACHTGAKQPEPARLAAEALAILRLPIPDDVASITPDVEALLSRLASEVNARPVRQLHVTSTPGGATVDVDGRPAACICPCVMELPAGTHVLQVSADGYTPSARAVTSDADFMLTPAEPELAAAQWSARRSRGESADSEASLRLLSSSLRAPRLVVLASEPATRTLRGALAIDGAVAARAEREGDVEGLLRDLLVRGQVVEEAPPLYKRWPFWVVVGATAVAAGVTAGVVVGTRQTITRVELSP